MERSFGTPLATSFVDSGTLARQRRDAAKHELIQALSGALSGPRGRTSVVPVAHNGDQLRRGRVASGTLARQRRDAAKHELIQAVSGALSGPF